MIDWYSKVVGIEVNFQFPGGAWTSNDRANHRLAFLAVPGLREDGEKTFHTGLHHTAFEYGSFADLMSSYARLKALGIEPEVCLNHGLTTSLYYVDPDENMVELQIDNFGDWDKSSEWMRSAPEFRANPLGAFFDPDPVLAAHQAGQPVAQILKDAYAGKYPPKKAPNLHLPPMP
jgi:catechol-2,3-dioxygenase